MRFRLLVPALLAALAITPAAGATTYYVSPAGNDASAGTSEGTAWRTLSRATSQTLQPGDRVLLQGGASFAETLSPGQSGTQTAPIVVGTYGTGRAAVRDVYLNSVSYLTIENLAISGSGQAVLASGSGTGVRGLTIRNCAITNVGIAINSANQGDAGWTIQGNQIKQTQDSAIIFYGQGFNVSGNTITDSGLSQTISYGKHGIYAKGPSALITGNTITGFQANGVSIRYQNAVVEGNNISGGPIAVAYFQDSSTTGRSVIRNNTLNGDTAGVYLDPSTVESFLVHDNRITSAGKGIHSKVVPALWIWSDTISAPQPIVSDVAYETTPPADYSSGGSTATQPAPEPQPAPAEPAPDTSGPTVAITSPAAGATVPLSLTIAAAASDPSGVAKVAFYVDNRLVCTDTSAAYACSVRLRAGSHALRVVAFDRLGNSAAVSISVIASSRVKTTQLATQQQPVSTATTLDRTGPTVAITSPAAGATVPLSLTIAAAASDPSGVAKVAFYVDNRLVCTDTSAAYACSVRLRAGSHALRVVAFDRLGNSAAASISVSASRWARR